LKTKKALILLLAVLILVPIFVTFITQTKVPNFSGFSSTLPLGQSAVYSPIELGDTVFQNFP